MPAKKKTSNKTDKKTKHISTSHDNNHNGLNRKKNTTGKEKFKTEQNDKNNTVKSSNINKNKTKNSTLKARDQETLKKKSTKSKVIFSKLKKLLYFLYIIIALGFIGYHLYYANKVIPKVFYRNIEMTGKSVSEVADLVTTNVPTVGNVILQIGEDTVITVTPDDIGFKFLPIDTTQDIYNVGRSGTVTENLKTQISAMFHPVYIDTAYTYDKNKAKNYLSMVRAESLDFVKEPKFVYVDGELKIIDGKSGYTFDENELAEQISICMTGECETNEIKVKLQKVDPILTLEDLDSVKPYVDTYLKNGITLYYDDFSYDLSEEELLSLLRISVDDWVAHITADENAVKRKIKEISAKVDKNPRGQVLITDGDKVIEFTAAQNGVKVKIKENTLNLTNLIEKSLFSNIAEDPKLEVSDDKSENTDQTKPNPYALELEVQITEAPSTENEFNIKDLIGIGKSRFKGSSKSRIHNVGLAASRVSGTLVPPGEIFSFNDAVGEISRKTGYTAAWVISKGRTVLGDGGGVCQVSTTMFRAALDAGLPIIERHAHSYRVSYYEQESPVGIDATIYSPSIDLRFKNDTPGYILIMADFDGDEQRLAFKIYGIDDGRKVEMTEPKILSRTPPPPPEYIEDPSLPKGKKVQVEHPVWGASVVFNRKVFDKNDSLIYDDTFKSNYRAWRAVYKVGTKE